MVEYLRGLVQTSLLFSLPLLTVLIGFTFSPAKQSSKIGYCGNILYFLFWTFSPDTAKAVHMALLYTHSETLICFGQYNVALFYFSHSSMVNLPLH